MKILILSTFEKDGGAAIAALRVCKALEKRGVQVRLISMLGATSMSSRPLIDSIINKFLFILDRLKVRSVIAQKKYLFKYSTGSFGHARRFQRLVQWADVVHLHWVQFGMISIADITRLATKKPVVWSLHDMWAFTGGCHYAMDCEGYKLTCDSCFYLKSGSKVSEEILQRKSAAWKDLPFSVITSSNWLADCARSSHLFSSREINVIGTTLSLEIFRPLSGSQLRKKYGLEENSLYILIGAVDLNDERKGFAYLLESLALLSDTIPELTLITFGKVPPEHLALPAISLGTIRDEHVLAEIYNLADVFIMPSVQDNLPNTVMESLACGIPVAGFDSGGIRDLVVDGSTGVLAKNRDPKDLAEKINILMKDKKMRMTFGKAARKHMEENYSEQGIASKHINCYETLLPSDL